MRSLRTVAVGVLMLVVVLAAPVVQLSSGSPSGARAEAEGGAIALTFARALASSDVPTMTAMAQLAVDGSPARVYLDRVQVGLEQVVAVTGPRPAGTVEELGDGTLRGCAPSGGCWDLSDFVSDASGRLVAFAVDGVPVDDVVGVTRPEPNEKGSAGSTTTTPSPSPSSAAAPSVAVPTVPSTTPTESPVTPPTTSAPTTTMALPTTTTATTAVPPTTTTVRPTTTTATTTVPPATTTVPPTTTTTPAVPGADVGGGSTYGGGPSGPLGAYTGPTVVETPTTISDVVITGRLEIRAAVTLRNVRLVCATGWACIRVLPSGSLDISDFSIIGPGQAGPQNVGGIIGENVVARRGEITGVENGVVMDRNVLVEDTYVHDLAHVGSAHPDGIQHDGGGSGLVLRRVRVDVGPTDTSAIMINNENGAVDGLEIEDSVLSGAGYTFYLDGSKSSAAIRVTASGNRFGSSGYGPALVRGPVELSQSGNTFIDGRSMSI